jgi:quinol monooxygenase YgiN
MTHPLVRIVRLHFLPEKRKDFQNIFEYGRNVVLSSEGCESLELLCDQDNPNVYYTISKWKSEKHLNTYRASEEFRNYWPEIKSCLKEKAEVWNLMSIEQLKRGKE